MISGYLPNGQFKVAQQLFDEMPVKGLVTRNIIISGIGAAASVVSWNDVVGVCTKRVLG